MKLLRHMHRAPVRVLRLQRRKSMIKIRFSMIRLQQALSQEKDETKQMLRIYHNYVMGHASKAELKVANQQLGDVLRATGLSIFAILPFAPITIPLIVKLGRKLGIEVMPSAFAPKDKLLHTKSVLTPSTSAHQAKLDSATESPLVANSSETTSESSHKK